MAFNGDVVRKLAAQFLALAQKQTATAPRMIGHRLMGMSLLHTGISWKGAHISLSRTRSTTLSSIVHWRRALVKTSGRQSYLWIIISVVARLSRGCARRRSDALKSAREIGQAATLMYTLIWTLCTYILRGNYAAEARKPMRVWH